VFFRNLNRGKKSMSLNLKCAAGREALLRIAQTVDVFIEAFRPGVAAKLGQVLRAAGYGDTELQELKDAGAFWAG
jgi:crotonobetainyl-CoA:carnitine CoA-transferase CaiB-like acyl-CoA transferase